MKTNYFVAPIDRKDAKEMFLNGHYLKRWPRISFLYGLFHHGALVGAISYGTPSSPAIKKSLVSEKFRDIVVELNRLFLVNNLKNEASFLIARSINLLPKPKIIVSYADNGQGHAGTIYKASNFIYCGKSEQYHYDWAVKGKDGLHQTTLFREFKNEENPIEKVKEKYGPLLYKKKRAAKDRYVYIAAKRRQRQEILRELKWGEKI